MKADVPIEKLYYFDILDDMKNLKIEYIDGLLESLMKNPRGNSTLKFDNLNLSSAKRLLKLFNKIQISTKFIEFLRFFLINMYEHGKTSIGIEKFLLKKMIMKKYGEIPMREYLTEFIGFGKKSIGLTFYQIGITNTDDLDTIFEKYYLGKCYELNDEMNFISRLTSNLFHF